LVLAALIKQTLLGFAFNTLLRGLGSKLFAYLCNIRPFEGKKTRIYVKSAETWLNSLTASDLSLKKARS